MDEPSPPPAANRALIGTLGFGVVMAVVLGGFAYLGSQEGPPHMPASPEHRLRIDLNGNLIGLDTDPNIEEALRHAGEVDVRSVEKRINTGCQACHGATGIDLTSHPCRTGAGRCLGEHHPPKLECIKCHRMAPSKPKAP